MVWSILLGLAVQDVDLSLRLTAVIVVAAIRKSNKETVSFSSTCQDLIWVTGKQIFVFCFVLSPRAFFHMRNISFVFLYPFVILQIFIPDSVLCDQIGFNNQTRYLSIVKLFVKSTHGGAQYKLTNLLLVYCTLTFHLSWLPSLSLASTCFIFPFEL